MNKNKTGGPSLIMQSVNPVFYCSCELLLLLCLPKPFAWHDHRLSLFHWSIQLNKHYLMSYFYLESTILGTSIQKEASYSTSMQKVDLPAQSTNRGTYSFSVFNTVCCIVATIMETYGNTGKHPPAWNLSDVIGMYSILIMQNNSEFTLGSFTLKQNSKTALENCKEA